MVPAESWRIGPGGHGCSGARHFPHVLLRGGLFAQKLILRTYFDNAGGLKNGAPVTLEGVTIGNITRIRVVPERSPTPVEVTMRVGDKYIQDLHVDSTTSIAQAGVLGDSYVDITPPTPRDPQPANNTELVSIEASSLQAVISASQASIEEVTKLMRNSNKLVDTLNSSAEPSAGSSTIRLSTPSSIASRTISIS